MTLTQLLIVCPLVFLAGLVDAISGGGGLLSLPAYMFAGLPVHTAIATNKMSSCMGTSVATAKYIRKKYVPWKLVPLCVAGAFLGSSAGAGLALRVSDFYFKILLLFLVPVAAFYVLKSKNLTEDGSLVIQPKTLFITALISLAVGVYDGFYGPGTGTFLILLLTFFTGMKLSNANGLTKVINWTTNVAALCVYLFHGKVYLFLGLTAGLFNIAGNYIGATLFSKNSGKFIKPFLLFILSLFYLKLLYELATSVAPSVLTAIFFFH